jgi:iron complex transport system substrate-binding protein
MTTRIRRSVRGALVATLALVVLAASACGDDGSEDASSGNSGSASSAGSFPATVEHEHGSTVVEEAPERVVTLATATKTLSSRSG